MILDVLARSINRPKSPPGPLVGCPLQLGRPRARPGLSKQALLFEPAAAGSMWIGDRPHGPRHRLVSECQIVNNRGTDGSIGEGFCADQRHPLVLFRQVMTMAQQIVFSHVLAVVAGDGEIADGEGLLFNGIERFAQCSVCAKNGVIIKINNALALFFIAISHVPTSPQTLFLSVAILDRFGGGNPFHTVRDVGPRLMGIGNVQNQQVPIVGGFQFRSAPPQNHRHTCRQPARCGVRKPWFSPDASPKTGLPDTRALALVGKRPTSVDNPERGPDCERLPFLSLQHDPPNGHGVLGPPNP